ncbi:MAG: hypothetical protein D8H99_68380 [Streptococcus sp.]|nr:MAG: hypothetical protein D8H99_68380 [Streptococcus sp.]
MKLKSDMFPYPVLSKELDDFKTGDFEVNISQKKMSINQTLLNFTFNLDNREINELIKQDKAQFVIHIEGQASSYRKLIYLQKGETTKEVELRSDSTPKKLFVNMMVIATDIIRDYKNKGFNPEYYGEDFIVPEIEKGSILAFDTMAELQVDFSNHEYGNLKSMVRIAKFSKRFMEVDLDGDVIQINLPEKSYIAYVNLSSSSKVQQQLLLVTIILPALTVAIEKVKKLEVDDSKEWYKSLGELLKKIDYNIEELPESEESSMMLAQQLLDFPLESSLYEYYKFEEMKNE